MKKYGALLAFLFPLATYIYGLAPDVVIEGDSGEIISGIHEFAVIHSPGFPGYVVLAKLFTSILFFLDIAYSVNLFSAFCGALCCLWVFRIGSHLGRPLSALGLAWTLGFANEFWYASLAAEVYTLALLILLVLCDLLMRTDFRRSKDSLKLGAALGLGIAIHVYTWALAPILALVGFRRWRQQSSPKSAFRYLFFGLLLGLTPYLYIPLRAGRSLYINEGGIDSLARFWSHVSWILQRERIEETQAIPIAEWLKIKLTQGQYFATEIVKQWTVLGLAVLLTLAFYGGYLLLQKRNRTALSAESQLGWVSLASAIFMPMVVWFLFSGNDTNVGLLAEMSVHLLTLYVFVILLSIYAVKMWPEELTDQPSTTDRKLGLWLVIVPLILWIWNIRQMNLNRNQIAMIHAETLLLDIPKDTIWFGDSDNDLMPTTYLLSVRQKRRDIAIMNLMNGTEWNYDNYRRVYPHIKYPNYYRYYYSPLVPLNFEKHPIYMGSWYGANAFLEVSKQKSKYDIIPIHGGFRLVTKGEDWLEKVKEWQKQRANQGGPRILKVATDFHMRDREKDVLASHSEYFLREAEYFLRQKSPREALAAIQIGLAVPTLGQTDYGRGVREALLKLQSQL